MRIMLVAEACFAGVGKHVLDLSKGMLDCGHQVHLVHNPSRTDKLFESKLASLRRPGFADTALIMSRSPSPKDLGPMLKLRALIREHGPFDVIHGHSSKGGALARLAGWRKAKAVLYTPHAFITANPEIGKTTKSVYGLIEWCLSLLATRIIAVSEEEKVHAASLGINPSRLEVIENGIELSACSVSENRRDELGIPNNALVIGAVGRLTPQKDPANLLAAFSIVAARFPSAHLAFVGEGPLRVELENSVREAEINDRVHFLGLRNGVETMGSFDIFALSSRYEGMPYVLIEAAACGLPIVSTTVAGSASLVVEGHNGFRVPSENPKAFAAAIERLLESAELRQRFAKESRKVALGFSMEAMVKKTETLYQRLTGF